MQTSNEISELNGIESDQCPIETETASTEEQTTPNAISIVRKRKLNDRTQAGNKKNALEKAYELISKPDDEFDIIGQCVAIKLRKMDGRQQLFCEKIINEALYQGLMGELNKDSQVTNQLLQNIAPTSSSESTAINTYKSDYGPYPYNNYTNNTNKTSDQSEFYNLQQNKNRIYRSSEVAESPTFIQSEPLSETTFLLNI